MTTRRTMGLFYLSCFLAASLLLISMGSHAAPPQNTSYHLVKKVVLGGPGGWDYLSADPVSHHVFISRGTHIMVLNPDGTVAGDIANVMGTHGAAIVPEFGRGFSSNGGSNSVTIFDLKTLATISEVKLPDAMGPDGFLYDPASKRVFTFNGRSNNATAVDAKSGEAVAGSVPLGGKPEAAQADGAGHVFVNIEDKNQIVEFDSTSYKILNTWPTAPCTAPGGLAIDIAHKRLFIGCHNNMMTVMDFTNGKVVDNIPIGTGVDASAFDPATGTAFSSCGDGTITAAHEDSPGHFAVDTIKTQQGARTMTLDTSNHNIYTVTAEMMPAPAPTAENPRPRPVPVPDTFTLLIFSR